MVWIMVALFIALAPAVHHHPIASDGIFLESPSACAVCAPGSAQVALPLPSASAPLVTTTVFAGEREPVITVHAPLPLASRAPPSL